MTMSLLRIGLVTEGPSDYTVLESILRTLCLGYELELQHLHPPRVPMKGIGTGWRAVKAWCIRYGLQLERLMQVTPDSPLHLLAIHVDGSAADKLIDSIPACPPARPTADALRQVIISDWLNRVPLPIFVVLAVPMQSTDTWVIAAHLRGTESICECEIKTDQRLFRLSDGFSWRDKKLKKPELAYRPLAIATGQMFHTVRTRCAEAERFCQEIDIATRTITNG